jgi:hypothetical protein
MPTSSMNGSLPLNHINGIMPPIRAGNNSVTDLLGDEELASGADMLAKAKLGALQGLSHGQR